jgi:hypothetical protein
MSAEQVHCPNCLALVPAVDINIAALVGKCGQCDHVFTLPQGRDFQGEELSGELPDCPSGIVHETGPGGECYLRRRWFEPGLFGLLLFVIFWDGFLVVWYSIAFFAVAKQPGDNGLWMMVLFPVLHVAVGVSLTYYVLAGFLNKTQILIDGLDLHVRHRPIPWIELDRSSSDGDSKFAVVANHIDGEPITLLSSLPKLQADFIARVVAGSLKVPLRKNFDEQQQRPVPEFIQRMARKLAARANRKSQG